MKQLRYLIDVYVCQSTRTKTDIGETYEAINELNKYYCYVVDNSNSVNEHDYGATIRNKKRVSSVRNELEAYLINLVDYASDNIGDYRLKINDRLYRIVDVKQTYVDAELI